MKTIRSLIFVLAACTIPSVYAENNSWGAWKDRDDRYIYVFGKDNIFTFKSVGAKWNMTRPRRWVKYPKVVDGVWRYSDKLCWSNKNKSRQYGNIMISVGSLQCCMGGQWLGKKLVLSRVWEKKADLYGICENRVLDKTKWNFEQERSDFYDKDNSRVSSTP